MTSSTNHNRKMVSFRDHHPMDVIDVRATTIPTVAAITHDYYNNNENAVQQQQQQISSYECYYSKEKWDPNANTVYQRHISNPRYCQFDHNNDNDDDDDNVSLQLEDIFPQHQSHTDTTTSTNNSAIPSSSLPTTATTTTTSRAQYDFLHGTRRLNVELLDDYDDDAEIIHSESSSIIVLSASSSSSSIHKGVSISSLHFDTYDEERFDTNDNETIQCEHHRRDDDDNDDTQQDVVMSSYHIWNDTVDVDTKPIKSIAPCNTKNNESITTVDNTSYLSLNLDDGDTSQSMMVI